MPTQRAERAIQLARLIRQVREVQAEFLRLHAAEEVARDVVGRREMQIRLSDPCTPDATSVSDASESPHDLNRPFKPHRLSFDP